MWQENTERETNIDRLSIYRRERRVLDEVYQHAMDCYPDECCGFVRASGDVHRAANDQDRLHAEDPVRWPRPARQAYRLADRDLLILNRSMLSKDPAVTIYHSHPDVGAYFSQTDAAEALYQGRPVYDVDYLVIDIRRGQPAGAKLFRFLNGTFRCVWSEALLLGSEQHQEEGQR